MMKYRQFGSTGKKLSILGMGGSGYGNVYGKYNEKEAIEGVAHAIQRGINYLDTAPWYGQGKSEKFLGKALQSIPRSSYYIGTKVARFERDVFKMFDFSAKAVTCSAEESLKRLQLDYVDLLQVHDIEFAPSLDIVINETLPALQCLRERGLCHHIGITGYPLSRLRSLVEQCPMKIDSVLSYCRLTLNDSSLTNEFDFYHTRNIGVINASPVSMGLLTNSGVQSWHPADRDIRNACFEAVQFCNNYDVDITRIAVNYSANFEEVVTTLVSMNDPQMVDRNIDAALEPLTEKEENAREYIIQNYFGPLKQKHWEGFEEKQYWKDIKEEKK